MTAIRLSGRKRISRDARRTPSIACLGFLFHPSTPDWSTVTLPNRLLNWLAESGMICLLIAAAGCGNADAPQLYPVSGTVTVNGSPLANATVTFQPDKGPIAFGATNLEGEYTLRTGGAEGVVAGPAKVSVTIPEPSTEPTEAEVERYMKTGEMPASATPRASPIPEKYTKTETSGLAFTVTDDPEQNTFDIELKP